MDNSSGVGVLDKAVLVLGALEHGPASLADLVASTSLSRPTAYRLAVALEHHRLVARDAAGRFHLGGRLTELADAAGEDRLLAAAGRVLTAARDATGESAQLYRRVGAERVCVAAADRPGVGLRDSVPVGAHLTLRAGSAAQVFAAWAPPEAPPAESPAGEEEAPFPEAVLAAVRRRGWAQSVGERESGVVSVSAPVRDTHGRVVAAVSISGPLQRLGRQPGRDHAGAVLTAAAHLTAALT